MYRMLYTITGVYPTDTLCPDAHSCPSHLRHREFSSTENFFPSQLTYDQSTGAIPEELS